VFRAADDRGDLIIADKNTLGFVRDGKRVTVIAASGRKMEQIAAFEASRDEYVTLKFSGDGVFVNGKKCGAAYPVKAKKYRVVVGYNPVFDVF
jgi:hypothetical protein